MHKFNEEKKEISWVGQKKDGIKVSEQAGDTWERREKTSSKISKNMIKTLDF